MEFTHDRCSQSKYAPNARFTEPADILIEARRYWNLGWNITPQVWGTKKPPARHRWKVRKRRPPSRDIDRWFGTERRNIAVIPGELSDGLCVRDFDDRDAYHDWRASHPDLAERLPTSRTRRGYHEFFRTDGNDPNIPKRKGVVHCHDGELKVSNSLITLPPSQHPDGGRYEWVIEPFHSAIPIAYDVASAGLIPPPTKTASECGSTQVVQPCQSMPTHFQKGGTQLALFCDDGTLSTKAFDDVLGWTLPTGFGTRVRCLWRLSRCLKTLDETRHFRIDELEPIVRHWQSSGTGISWHCRKCGRRNGSKLGGRLPGVGHDPRFPLERRKTIA